MKHFLSGVLIVLCYLPSLAQCGVQVTTTPVLCNGDCNGTATAYPFGGMPPYSYNWSNGDSTQTSSGFCAGTYLVYITDSLGCQATAFFTIGTPAPLFISFNVTPASCSPCCDGSITPNVAGGTGSVTYSWTGPNSYTSSQANISNLCTGTYTLCVTDANGCTRCQTATVNFSTDVASLETENDLIVLPNPAGDRCIIQADFVIAQIGTIYISNYAGQVVEEITFASTEFLNQEVDLSAYGSGIYLVLLRTENGVLKHRLIVQ